MRKSLVVLVALSTLSFAGATVSCSAAWWSEFSSNPVEQIQTFEQGTIIVLNTAQAAWSVIQPLLPSSAVVAVTQQYENAVVAVNHAIQILNDAVTAALAAETPNPSFAVLMSAVTDAISQVLAIIDQYVTNTSASWDGGVSASTSAAVEAHAGLAKLQKLAAH
jgi:hypothetical protein